jgi:hypothetical protein
MATETIIIRPGMTRDDQDELVAGRTIANILLAGPNKILTVQDPVVTEEAEISLVSLKRDELDAMAEELGLDPSDYRTKADIAAAIEEAQ